MITKTMKKFLFAAIAAVAMMAAACNQLPESTPIDAQDVEVVGVGSGQLSVVDELYKLNCRETSKGSGMWLLNLRVKFKAGIYPTELMDSPYLMLTNEGGIPIEGTEMKVGENAMDNSAVVNFKAFAAKGDGSEQTFCFYLNLADKETVANIMDTAKGIIVYANE